VAWIGLDLTPVPVENGSLVRFLQDRTETGGPAQVSDLIDTTEMYLRTIFELEEEGIVPLRARIAERLGHSGPTVSQTVARMERDGLLRVSGDRHLELTAVGREKATRVMRKHRLAERLLLDVIRLEWELVHDEACRWEHVMSDRVERKLLPLLGDLRESPYGNAIPGLEEIGGQSLPEDPEDGLLPLTAALGQHLGEVDVVVRRFGETLQTDTRTLGELVAAGLRPGAVATATSGGARLRLSGPSGAVDLSMESASHVFVSVAVA
jgi:DtxR family transcriptional regulator, Mn-dependent transcriptional regulator